MKACPSEHMEQVQFVAWLRRTYPGHPVFANTNGGNRSGAAGARLKAEGATRGIPDLYIPTLRLWVEMKKKGGRVSPEQEAWRTILEATGHAWISPVGAEEAKRMLQDRIIIPHVSSAVDAAVETLKALELKRLEDKKRRRMEAIHG